MTHIPIPITKIGEAPVSGTFFTSLLATLVLGVFLGAISANVSLFGSPETTESNLAGVGATLQPEEAGKVASFDVAQPTDEENVFVVTENLETPPVNAEFTPDADEFIAPDTTLPFLVTSPEELEASRERLTNEIEQIKNESVALIAEFRTNCGVWADECATPYKTRLERNNARYEELELLLR